MIVNKPVGVAWSYLPAETVEAPIRTLGNAHQGERREQSQESNRQS